MAESRGVNGTRSGSECLNVSCFDLVCALIGGVIAVLISSLKHRFVQMLDSPARSSPEVGNVAPRSRNVCLHGSRMVRRGLSTLDAEGCDPSGVN